MKKFILMLILTLLSAHSVYASPLFDRMLSEEISEYGLFDGTSGIVYADKCSFSPAAESLLIVRAQNTSVHCEIYDNYDGIQLTDTLELPLADKCSLSLAESGDINYLVYSSPDGKHAYTIENDMLTAVNIDNYTVSALIVQRENGKASAGTNIENIPRFLNSLKEETIAGYPFSNKVNIISEADLSAIRSTLTACADIMSFDIQNYDYDTLFRYILYTHQNFRILCDIDPLSGSSSSLGYNNVSIVSSEYIDYIMNNIFRITPEKPPVNNLMNRSFCYSGGYYFYTGGFSKYFATEIRDISAVYDMGGGVVFTVFSDIYSEEGKSTPEYSFALLQKTGSSYSLLRLGMGENLPSADEVRKYSPFFMYNSKSQWGAQENKPPSNSGSYVLLLPILLLIISIGSVVFICSIIALIKQRR